MAKLSSIVPKQLLPSAQATKRIISDFAETSGMVYFGYVSQRSDEHHIVRGLTVSTKHVDDHYCIGTHEGYDVVFVERSDTLRSGKRHIWHIMEFDLRTTVDIPHIFVGSATHGHGFHELLDTKYPFLQAVTLGSSGHAYDSEFSDHFAAYVTPSSAVMMEHLLTSEVTSNMATHFKGLVVELTEQALYIYSEKTHVSPELLHTMLTNGVWLAQQIDMNSRHLDVPAR